MTNPSIPPCPACGVVPVKHAKNDRILLCGCFEEYGAMMTDVVSLQKYQLMCVDMLGRACRELGIETVEQLKAKVQPDPRVALLDELGLHSTDDVRSVVGKAVAYNRQTPDPRVAVLEKSREVCEWAKSATDPNSEAADYAPIKCLTESMWNIPNYCPSCGRKVVVK